MTVGPPPSNYSQRLIKQGKLGLAAAPPAAYDPRIPTTLAVITCIAGGAVSAGLIVAAGAEMSP